MIPNLPHQFALATGLAATCVVIHLLGLDTLMRLTSVYLHRATRVWRHFNRLVVPLALVLGLFALHGVEIWVYALAFRILDIVPGIEEALFVSTSNYSTLGEAGETMPVAWRIVGVFEAINGMLLIGWSTAFLFQALSHLTASEDDQLLPRGAIARPSPRRRGSGKASPAGTKVSDTELMQ